MDGRTRPRVVVIGTGGTISSVGRDPLDVWEYMDHSKKLEADELVAEVPELAVVAGAPEARGLGVLVLLNDEIQAARDVTKSSTLRLETFRSHDLGMLGYADPDGRVAIYRRPTRRHAPATEFDVRAVATLPRVDI